ncbi:hypothetical protein AB0D16_18950 [Streptomyces sp. NPDC048161]|uniref:hypothetical protein n=1 Tax=unclassified Streptomyces TaxID=2593676 RepID=UPI0033FA9F49
MAIADWGRHNPNLRFIDAVWGGRSQVVWEHVTIAATEAFRLALARHQRPIGDLDLERVVAEPGYWWYGNGYPEPGSAEWPAPPEPYQADWHHLFVADTEGRGCSARSTAKRVMDALLWHTARHSPIPVDLRRALSDYRMEKANYDYVGVAEAAPLLGINVPIEVSDPLWFQGVQGLTLKAV